MFNLFKFLNKLNIISDQRMEKIKKNLSGKEIIREIYVPGKIVNLVIQ